MQSEDILIYLLLVISLISLLFTYKSYFIKSHYTMVENYGEKCTYNSDCQSPQLCCPNQNFCVNPYDYKICPELIPPYIPPQ